MLGKGMFLNGWEPRTDKEMLVSLLSQGEGPHLDFKMDIDWDSTEARVKFVKDVVSLINTHPGGHLIIGVNDDGSPASEKINFNRNRYDSASLMDLVSKYIDAPIDIRSQIHIVEGHEYAIIAVLGRGSWLPIPMSRQGNYMDLNGKQKHVFRAGDIFIREGSKNVSIKYVHWEFLIKRHDKQIRDQAYSDINLLIKKIMDFFTIYHKDTIQNPPLLIETNYDIQVKSVNKYLENNNIPPLQQFIRQFVSSDAIDIIKKLTILTLLGVQALNYNNKELVIFVIDELYDLYELMYDQNIHNRLEIVVFLYIIGSACVRYKRWYLISFMVLKNSKSSRYRYWIKEIQVYAFMNKLIRENSGNIIDIARAYMSNIPELRPDFIGELSTDNIPLDEIIINSLCEFDFIQVMLHELTNDVDNQSKGYPLCAFYARKRIEKFLLEYVRSSSLRTELTNSDDETLNCKVFRDALYIYNEISKNDLLFFPDEIVTYIEKIHNNSNF